MVIAGDCFRVSLSWHSESVVVDLVRSTERGAQCCRHEGRGIDVCHHLYAGPAFCAVTTAVTQAVALPPRALAVKREARKEVDGIESEVK